MTEYVIFKTLSLLQVFLFLFLDFSHHLFYSLPNREISMILLHSDHYDLTLAKNKDDGQQACLLVSDDKEDFYFVESPYTKLSSSSGKKQSKNRDDMFSSYLLRYN